MKVGRIISAVITAASLAVLMSGCRQTAGTGHGTIPYVESLLADSASVGYSRLSSFEVTSRGAITVIGPQDRCLALAERFLSFDVFDNVDGRAVPDRLPDFAGEDIHAILDIANAPYEPYVASNGTFLREIAVRNVLLSFEKGCSLSPFDREHIQQKAPAKVIIFATPMFCDYGESDVDTLLRSAGKSVPVLVSHSEETDSLIVADCFRILRQRNLFTHKVAFPTVTKFLTYPVAGLPDSSYDPSGMFTDEYKYSRAENSGFETYLLLAYSQRYMPQTDNSIRDILPKVSPSLPSGADIPSQGPRRPSASSPAVNAPGEEPENKPQPDVQD